MKHLWIILFCFYSSSHAEVYRWYDQQGRVVYSDEFHPDAEIIDMPSLSTYVPAPILQPVIEPHEDAIEGEPDELIVPNYQIRIVTPENDESFWANDGNVSVDVEIRPELDRDRDDKLIIMVDSQQQGGAISTTNFTLSNLDRGTHSVVVSVVDDTGKVLKLSSPVSFHIHRRSVAQ